VHGNPDGDLPATCDPLALDADRSVGLGSVVPTDDGTVEVRLFNAGPEPASVSMSATTEWCRAAGLSADVDAVDLQSSVLEPSVALPLSLAPWRITTLRFRPDHRD
jgi:hypothetical protein